MPQMSDLARHGRHTTQCPQHTPNLDNALRAKIASHLRSGLPTGVVYRFISFHYFFTLRRLSIPPLRPPPLSLRVFLCTALGRCFCFICCFLFFFYCCFTAENPKLTKKTHSLEGLETAQTRVHVSARVLLLIQVKNPLSFFVSDETHGAG